MQLTWESQATLVENIKREAVELNLPKWRIQRLLKRVEVAYQSHDLDDPKLYQAVTVVFRIMMRKSYFPSMQGMRLATELATKFIDRTNFDRLLSVLIHTDGRELQSELASLSRELAEMKRIRHQNRLHVNQIKPAVNQYMKFLFHPRKNPLIVLKHGGSFEASCNGKQIFLPADIEFDLASNDDKQIPTMILMFLATHEAQHFGIFGGRGSFDFSFDSSDGKTLMQFLLADPNRKEMFEQNKYEWRGSAVLKRIKHEEGIVDEKVKAVLTHLEAMSLFALRPRIIHFLYNLFEDLRLNRQIQQTGLRHLMEVCYRAASKQATHPAVLSDQERLWQTIIDWLSADPSPFPWPKQFEQMLRNAKQVFDEYAQLSFNEMSPEKSGLYAWKLHEVLDTDQSESSRNEYFKLAQAIESFMPKPTLTEIMSRWQLYHQKRGKRQKAGTDGEPSLIRQIENQVNGVKLDEYNFDLGDVERNAVTLKLSNFKPKRPDYPQYRLPDYRSLQLSESKSTAKKMGTQRRRSEEGDEFIMEKLPEFVAELVAGSQPKPSIYWGKRSSKAQTKISVVVDLSESMAYVRSDLPAKPIQMATDLIQRMVVDCERNGLLIDVFGLHGLGRQPNTLYRVHRKVLNRLHPISVGDARLGAGLRYLSNTAENRSLHRHFVFLISDGSPAYIKAGNEELVGRIAAEPCSDCPLLTHSPQGCHAELNMQLRTDDSWATHENAHYQYSDIAHAMENMAPNTRAYSIEFNAQPLTNELNSYLVKQ